MSQANKFNYDYYCYQVSFGNQNDPSWYYKKIVEVDCPVIEQI